MIDWTKVIKQKTTDLDGRKVERLIYPRETHKCQECRFFYHELVGGKQMTRCKKYPGKFWRATQCACVVYEPENPFEE